MSNFGNLRMPRNIAGILLCAFFWLTSSSCSAFTENIAVATLTSTPEIYVTPLTGEMMVKVDVANLRSGPGADFELIGSLTREETVVIDGVSAGGTWYRLTDGSWIASDFVEMIVDEPSETPTASSTTLPPDTLTPSPTSAPVLTSLPPDTLTPSPTAAPSQTSLPPDTLTPSPTLAFTPTRLPPDTLTPTATVAPPATPSPESTPYPPAYPYPGD